MFERLKKVFSSKPVAAEVHQLTGNEVSEWAGTRGFAYTNRGDGRGFALDGKIGAKDWRLERGRPSRNFIRGEELRCRADLGVNEDLAVLILNRPLKDALEKKAYQLYTDDLQTTADPNLPEEMRWLAMYDEVGWEGPPASFWERYAIVAGSREQAMSWVDTRLSDMLMRWPEPGPHSEVPFILMLLRGKAYLRMEYNPPDIPTLEHASAIFRVACESAMEA